MCLSLHRDFYVLPLVQAEPQNLYIPSSINIWHMLAHRMGLIACSKMIRSWIKSWGIILYAFLFLLVEMAVLSRSFSVFIVLGIYNFAKP